MFALRIIDEIPVTTLKPGDKFVLDPDQTFFKSCYLVIGTCTTPANDVIVSTESFDLTDTDRHDKREIRFVATRSIFLVEERKKL